MPARINRPEGTYHGWANWDTWSAHLWLTNEEGAYRAAREVAQRPRPLVRDMREVYATHVPWTNGAKRGDGADLTKVVWDEVIAALREE